ncbi:MAG: hypothetical protein QNK23_16770 [Crocinitomicaceae bacterium]|nr:hypothetical protein [Crocinitomicaceae bacterium]
MIWRELTQGKKFITDMGYQPAIVDLKTAQQVSPPRYALWIPTDTGDQHAIAEVSDDLALLKRKHNIKEDEIFELI